MVDIVPQDHAEHPSMCLQVVASGGKHLFYTYMMLYMLKKD